MKLGKIILFIVLFHAFVVLFFFSSHTFCVDGYIISLPVKEQMNKAGMSPFMLSHMIHHGEMIQSHTKRNRCLFVDNETKIGVVVNMKSGEVINVIRNITAYDILMRQDTSRIKKRIRS